jgi:hypothetical protein
MLRYAITNLVVKQAAVLFFPASRGCIFISILLSKAPSPMKMLLVVDLEVELLAQIQKYRCQKVIQKCHQTEQRAGGR